MRLLSYPSSFFLFSILCRGTCFFSISLHIISLSVLDPTTMSYYDDRRYHRPSRDRDRYARPSYIDEPYVGYKGRDRDTDFVRRRYDDSDDSLVEEAHRDFAPGEYGPGYYRYGHGRPRHSRTVLEGRPHSTGGRDPYYGDGYYYYRPDSRCRSKRYDDRRMLLCSFVAAF